MKKIVFLMLTLVLFLSACSLESPLKKENEGKTNKKKSEMFAPSFHYRRNFCYYLKKKKKGCVPNSMYIYFLHIF